MLGFIYAEPSWKGKFMFLSCLSGLFLFLLVKAALNRWTAFPLAPIQGVSSREGSFIRSCKPPFIKLTSINLLTSHYQVVDVAFDLNELLVPFCLLIPPATHQFSNVVWEERRLHGVDDVEEVSPVDSSRLSLFINQIWKVRLQQSVLSHSHDQVCYWQLWHLRNIDHWHLAVWQDLYQDVSAI